MTGTKTTNDSDDFMTVVIEGDMVCKDTYIVDSDDDTNEFVATKDSLAVDKDIYRRVMKAPLIRLPFDMIPNRVKRFVNKTIGPGASKYVGAYIREEVHITQVVYIYEGPWTPLAKKAFQAFNEAEKKASQKRARLSKVIDECQKTIREQQLILERTRQEFSQLLP